MQDQNKNMILAIALSMAVIFGWAILFPQEDSQPALSSQLEALPEGAFTPPVNVGGSNTPPVLAGEQPAPSTATPAPATVGEAGRIDIRTVELSGSISLLGGRIDDLHLTEYNVNLGDESEKVILMSPTDSNAPYYAVWGWAGTAAGNGGGTPNATTLWELESGITLTSRTPITLKWNNGAGLTFRRTISVDDQYMFDIAQSVENTTGQTVRLAPYGIIARHGEPDTAGFYLLHEGVVRASDGEIEELNYDDMPDFDVVPGDGPVEIINVQENGWVGFTDKYWMATLIPQPGQAFTSVAKYTPATDTYQTDMRLPPLDVASGETATMNTSLFAGAKVVKTIKAYEAERGIDRFIDSIDWGWFYFITKPMQGLLAWVYGIVGNMGFAIIGLTLLVKLLLFPLAYKSAVSMAKMKKLQPEMVKLKERFGDDRQKLQKETMAFYKKEKVNPAAGCLPILVQIPIFFALYKVLFVSIEMRHAPFIGWIKDLSAPDPSSWINLFGLLPYDVSWAPQLLSIGLFPVLMGITMWMQQKLNPAPTEKTQAMILAWMPWVFMFMLGGFASGLVIYWVANNTITFIQQYLIMLSQGVKPDVFGNILSGFKNFKKKKDD
ncbi:MAG: membrane protein insertase YidC [Rhodobacteraceae bacterium]|nr:membrane protein insertase YidC [Paracoccaceae bacterium]